MQPDIVLLTVRQLLSRGKVIILAGVVALPAFLSFIYVASSSTLSSDRFLSRLCDGLVLTTVLPVIALTFGGAALGNEVEDGTLIHLVMKPVARWMVVASKLVPAAVIVSTFAMVSVLLAAVVSGLNADTLRVGVAFAIAVAAGGLAYTTVFLLLGLITSRSLIIGLVYVFLWEGLLTALFPGLRTLSIREYARGIAAALANLPVSELDVKMSATGAITGIAIATVVCFALAVRRLDVMDLE